MALRRKMSIRKMCTVYRYLTVLMCCSCLFVSVATFVFFSPTCGDGDFSRMNPFENRQGVMPFVTLMYHKISTNPASWGSWSISPEKFEADIKDILAAGYTPISMNQLAEMLAINEKGRLYEYLDQHGIKKPIVITFDDCHDGFYLYALPILEKYRVPACFFITTSLIDTPGNLATEQLIALSWSPYVTLGIHTDSIHLMKRWDLESFYQDPKNLDAVLNDYRACSDRLKALTGKVPFAIAYPYGYYTDIIDDTLRAEGYLTFSTVFDINQLEIDYQPFNRYNRDNNLELPKLLETAQNKIKSCILPSSWERYYQ